MLSQIIGINQCRKTKHGLCCDIWHVKTYFSMIYNMKILNHGIPIGYKAWIRGLLVYKIVALPITDIVMLVYQTLPISISTAYVLLR